jgi:hypothetical protein
MKKTIYRTLLGVCGFLILSIAPILTHKLPAQAQKSNFQNPFNLPTTTFRGQNNIPVQAPDYGFLTFDMLGPISGSGGFDISQFLSSGQIQQLSYDPSRVWKAGQSLSSVLMLGDIVDLGPGLFNLDQIFSLSSINPSQISLANVGFLQFQSLGNVVQAIPALSNLSIAQAPALQALLSQNQVPLGNLSTYGELVQNSQIANLPLKDLQGLAQFGLDSIPGLSGTEIQNFNDWGQTAISEIPGLSSIPLNKFPKGSQAFGAQIPYYFGLVDVAFGKSEGKQTDWPIQQSYNAALGPRRYAVTGTIDKAIPCDEKSCSYLELTDPILPPNISPLHGQEWISGQSQKVSGGSGFCAAVGGGKEPTGRHPFGSSFKVVLEDVTENQGEGAFALYFRIDCGTWLGKTPYILGPIPFWTSKEGDWVILGQSPNIEIPVTRFTP